LTGYFAIHLLGLSTGTLILPPSPSYFRHIQQDQARATGHRRNSNTGAKSDNQRNHPGGKRRDDKTVTELCSYAVIWWALMGLARVIGIGTDVSRRMVCLIFSPVRANVVSFYAQVNLPYILWIAAFNTSSILGYFLIDLYLFPSSLSTSEYSTTSTLKAPTENPNHPIDYSQQQQRIGDPPALLDAINKNGLALFLLVRDTIETRVAQDSFHHPFLFACALALLTRLIRR
jgi:phosphatidylinositol glycan class W